MPSNVMDRRIAERMREGRQFLELTVEELADMLSISPEEVLRMESGEESVAAARLSEVARTLGRSLEFFTGEVTARTASERTDFLARAAETLSDQDMGELQRFATYLRSRSESHAA